MRVGLFVTCLVDLVRPSIGFATLELLEAAGCEVIVPERQTCCGQPGYNSGDFDTPRSLARELIEQFADCDYIVAPSGSCAGMIRVHYPELFKDEPALLDKVKALRDRTYELTDFLVNVLGVEFDLKRKLERAPGDFPRTVTYHDSCAGLRELGVKAQPRALLAKLPDVQLMEMNEAEKCCGFGGTFSIKLGEISTRMAENKCANIAASGADAVVGGDLGCLLNIEGRLRRNGDYKTRVLHIAEVLAPGND
jgi:L-lactate dehydrogenase complex protein LldE